MVLIKTISWDNLEHTKNFVKSLQKLDFNHYLMIWDNGSKDGTLEWLKESQNKWLNSDWDGNKTRYFEYNHSELNEGMPICWNMALSKMMQIPMINQTWLCNNDIKFTKSMNDMPKFVEENKEYGMICPAMIPREIPDEYIDEYALDHAKEQNNRIEVGGLEGPVMIIPKHSFEKVGFMDEKFKFSFEDMDYHQRVHKVGLKTCVYHGCSTWHYQGASTGKNKLDIKDNPYYKIFQEKHG